MCLYTYDKEPLIAKEDIICYKVVTCIPQLNLYETPIIGVDVSEYIKNNTLWRDFMLPPTANQVDKDMFGKPMYEIGIGYIHALRIADYTLVRVNKRLFKCIIPKGTEYYIGLNNDICARAIQFVEEYKFEEEC